MVMLPYLFLELKGRIHSQILGVKALRFKLTMNHQITFTTSGPVMNRYDVSWKVDGGILNIVRQIFDI